MSSSFCVPGSDDRIGPPVSRDCRSFDFTLLFEDVVLRLVPATVVTLALLPRLAYLWKAPVKVLSNRLVVYKLVSKGAPLTLLFRSLTKTGGTHFSAMFASPSYSLPTWKGPATHTSFDCLECRQYHLDMCSLDRFPVREPAKCAPIVHSSPLLLLRNDHEPTTHPNLMADSRDPGVL